MSSTVVARVFKSTPQREAGNTWSCIIELLTRGESGAKRDELKSVAGIASSILADQAPKDAAIIVTCDGPRTRIYCLYDEAAIEGDDAKEDPLSFDPLKGDWKISLPCEADDLQWVQDALKAKSSRITARDKSEAVTAEEAAMKSAAPAELILDTKGFLGQ